MSKKVLIVGGVAGGASCAARLRRLDEDAEIIMFERGEYISFANCGLPYHVGGVIEDRDNLLLQTPEDFNSRFKVDVRMQSEVIEIDREGKKVHISDSKHNTKYWESYDKLVLSTGSSSLKPPIPGIDNEGIFSLWNIPDMDSIIAYLEAHEVEHAAVIGGGFIGVEMAENLMDRGIKVTLIEMLDQVLAPLDFDMAQSVHRHMAQKGLNLVLGDGVSEFIKNGDKITVKTQSGREVEAGFVALAIGVRPNTELLKGANLAVNRRGGAIIDDTLKTEDENIYAIGDMAEVTQFVNGEKVMIPLAGPANKMGRMAADNICGMDRKYKGSQGSSVVKAFDMTAATTGLNEKQLIASGKKIVDDYRVTIIHPKSHAGYYPGAMPLTLKLIFDLEGKILGGQAVGFDGVAKRIDVLATAQRLGATIYDLEELELCYAPPYSSAKDPVNMAGFSAENILSGTVNNITYAQLKEMDDVTLLDVRTPAEVKMGSIEGNINIPVDDLRSRVHEVPKDKPIVVYCAVGVRAYISCRILAQNGYENVYNLAGGYTTYRTVNEDYTEKGTTAPKGDVKKNLPEGSEIIVNACGLQCPGPVMKLHEAVEMASSGEVIKISATDPGFFADVQSWCQRTGNTYLEGTLTNGQYIVRLMKGGGEHPTGTLAGNDKTMVVFSGDLDKALASFIIANGGAAMGRKVTMFFTFWGLNILRKGQKIKVPKTFMEKLFGFMMPRGSKALKLSKMNMGGMGTKMMKNIMKKKNVSSLEELIQSAINNGVRVVACTMSMDIMGIKREELIDGIEYAGVASYLGASETADTTLFI